MIAKNKKTKKQNKWQDNAFSILLGLFLAVALWFLVSSNLQVNQKRASLISRVEELREEISVLSARNEQLKSGLAQSQDDDYWKGRLYEQGYVVPGEEAVVIVPPPENREVAEEKEKNWLETVKGIFGF
jgi:cell division protein FtsB